MNKKRNLGTLFSGLNISLYDLIELDVNLIDAFITSNPQMDLNQEDSIEGVTVLQKAIIMNNFAAVIKLLNYPNRIDIKRCNNPKKHSALYFAISYRNFEMLQLLLKFGTDINLNHIDTDGMNAFCFFLKHVDQTVVNSLNLYELLPFEPAT